MAAKLDARTQSAAEEIGRRIRAARQAAGISQESLASRIGMTRANYARIEHGRTNVTIDSLLRIADGIGVKMAVSFTSTRGKRKTQANS